MKTIITEELYQYAIKYGVKEHEVLRQIREYNTTLPNGHMQISCEHAQFMGILAKLINAKKYLEIGVFTGYSTLAMALSMTKANIFAIDISQENLNIAKNFWAKANMDTQINIMCGDATAMLEKLCTNEHIGTFDIAFIDANKTAYLEHFNLCYELIRKNGIIMIDNVLMHGLVIEANAPNYAHTIHDFNVTLYNDPRVDIVILPFADGLTIAYKK